MDGLARRGASRSASKPVTLESAGEVDVLLFPGDRLGDLIDADRLAAIPNEAVMPPARDATVDRRDRPASTDPPASRSPPRTRSISWASPPPYRDQVTRYGNDRMALPYGGSALVLVYRRDAFEREANRAAADRRRA